MADLLVHNFLKNDIFKILVDSVGDLHTVYIRRYNKEQYVSWRMKMSCFKIYFPVYLGSEIKYLEVFARARMLSGVGSRIISVEF